MNMPSHSRKTASEKPLPQEAGTHQPTEETRWVLSATTGERLSREELLARYRRQRGLPEDPFEPREDVPPPPSYRSIAATTARPAVEFRRVVPQAPAPTGFLARLAERRLSIGQSFAMAAALALVSGGMVGFMNASLSSFPAAAPDVTGSAPRAPLQAEVAAVVPKPQPAEAQSAKQDAEDKSVPTATLQVADASGETNSFIPLALHAEPSVPGEDILLKISGIPEGAYLTSGRQEANRIWALTLADSRNVKLVVPATEEPRLSLAVAAVEPATGQLAAPVKTMTVALSDVVVEPAAGPPPTQQAAALPATAKAGLPAAIPPPQSINVSLDAPAASPAQTLIHEGDARLKYGDVGDARKAYEKAWQDGSPAGAFALARSFDPLFLARLGLRQAKPDKAQALAWYEKAASAGHADAAAAIVRLKLKR